MTEQDRGSENNEGVGYSPAVGQTAVSASFSVPNSYRIKNHGGEQGGNSSPTGGEGGNSSPGENSGGNQPPSGGDGGDRPPSPDFGGGGGNELPPSGGDFGKGDPPPLPPSPK